MTLYTMFTLGDPKVDIVDCKHLDSLHKLKVIRISCKQLTSTLGGTE